MSYESPNLNLFSTDGYEVPVQNNVATPVGTRGFISAGSDGSVTRFNLVDTSGRQIIAWYGGKPCWRGYYNPGYFWRSAYSS
jgi:hypothetical protein